MATKEELRRALRLVPPCDYVRQVLADPKGFTPDFVAVVRKTGRCDQPWSCMNYEGKLIESNPKFHGTCFYCAAAAALGKLPK